MDRELVIILIKNFIDNAIKTCRDGGEICINTYTTRYKIIEIRDNGVGIPNEDIKNIFEPFYMVDKSGIEEIMV
ncbi:ATP-binding protein [Clostridium sp. CT7]|uniref:ATP-binding protein n=2 Tax=Clostridium TaxID=1485 RepID=UPI0011118B88|nr:ATP-binding protein [Clostridium sp. CT7]